MAGSPQVPQGNLNRILATVMIPSYPQLIVTAPFLGEEGVGLAWEDAAATLIRTLTGVVSSDEPYQLGTITVNLLKSQLLAQLYETQRQVEPTVGKVIVTPDAATLGPFSFYGCVIRTVRDLRLSGRDAGYVVTIQGAYPTSSALWS